ncbi:MULTISPECIES: glutamate 5-kinase [Acidithrix]|uniref:Glutamate 5-kinase n=1 Tax=Acidithrix ferrooxidans TaxID=1280514 RepID=A0A0D8HLK9_9ACTN|nr:MULTISPECIES: glutamate 5-kinase [Acidithrix]KJF18860.1 glutamate 5-kinase [Acidithrix ferrooxidans]
MNLVVKIGSSSVTTDEFEINEATLNSLCSQIVKVSKSGHKVVVVTSGAIAIGLGMLGLTGDRPTEMDLLQVASGVGQGRLFDYYAKRFSLEGLLAGQILLSGSDFMERRQYLSAKATLSRMLEMGVIPIVNENDAIADDEIRLGDNDRIAALVAGLVGADTLVLLTDQDGLFSGDPRIFEDATLIEQVEEVSRELAAMAGGRGTTRGSGGMMTKVMAARIAAWSGVETLITSASNASSLDDAIERVAGIGTWVAKSRRRLAARKLWIAFALPIDGFVTIDEGARRAITQGGSSLLYVGVRNVGDSFEVGSAIEVRALSGEVVAKGLARISGVDLLRLMDADKSQLGSEFSSVLIHRDDLIVLE